jgi:hypothetical protein
MVPVKFRELPNDVVEFEEEDYYDRDGNVSASGMYDAGGHLVAARWADFADDLRDRDL